MALVRQTSFASGELAPTLYGRTDLGQYSNGLRRCRNFFISRHGAAVSRPGMEHVYQIAWEGGFRLIPFVVSENDAFLIILRVSSTAGGFEFVRNGVRVPFTLNTALYDAATLHKLKWAQVGNYLTLTHPDYPPQELHFGGASDSDWTISAVSFELSNYAGGAVRAVNRGVLPPKDEDGVDMVQPSSAELPPRDWDYRVTNILRRRDGSMYETAPARVTTTTNGGLLPPPNDGPYPDKIKIGAEWPLTLLSYRAVLATEDEPVATIYYRGRGKIFGWVGQLEGMGVEFIDYGDLPDYSQAPPEGRNPFRVNDGVGVQIRIEDPATVAFFENRQVFGGTAERPNAIWLSKANDYLNFDQREAPFPLVTDPIELSLASQHREEIRAMLGIDALLVFTDASVWAVSSGSGGPIGPTDYGARLQSETGSSWLQPVVVGGHVLYVATKGAGVRNLAYDDNRRRFVGADVTLFAEHFLDGYEIVDWTYAADPWSVVWAVRSDGKLLSLTYVPEMGVWSWSLHETQGKVKAIASVPDGREDVVYLIVERTLGGVVGRHVERFATRKISDVRTAKCLDACELVEQSPSVNVAGFVHLRNQAVTVLADGEVIEGLTVSSTGTLELPVAASKVVAGLPFVCSLETLDVANARSDQKIVRKVAWEVEAARGLWTESGAGLWMGEGSDAIEWRQRVVADSTAAMELFTGTVEQTIPGRWDKHGRVLLEQRVPLPLTVLGVTRDIMVGG